MILTRSPLPRFLHEDHERQARDVFCPLRPVRALTERQLARRRALYGAALDRLSGAAQRLADAANGDDGIEV